ncbi:MAG: YbeD family protein [Phycisphaerales bacterium]
MDALHGRQPDIEYPANWSYTVIGSDEPALRRAIASILTDRKHSIRPANTSRTGKYVSLRIDLVVMSERERLGYYEALRSHEAVRMTL